MNESEVSAGPRTEAPTYADYASAAQRQSLFRVLASNLVRELRASGYRGSDLLGFVAELMGAVTASGFADLDATPPPASGPPPPTSKLSRDALGRPSILGQRVLLRPPADEDGVALEAWRADPMVRDSLAPQILNDILSRLAVPRRMDRVDFMVCLPEATAPFGAVSLFGIDPHVKQAEVGKVIGDAGFRGRGLASEATKLLVRYGFDELGLDRVYLRTLGGNIRNIKLNERIGFRFEGVLRDAVLAEGRLHDVVLMALLRREFEARRAGVEPADAGVAREAGAS